MSEPNATDAAIEAYIAHLRDKKLADLTLEIYANDLRSFSNYLGITSLVTATTDQVTEWIEALPSLGCKSPKSAARKLSVLRGFYAHLVTQTLIETNPTFRVKKVRLGPQKRLEPSDVLSPAEVMALMAQPDLTTQRGIRDVALMQLLYTTGLCISELIDLELTDIDLQEGIVSIVGRRNRTRKIQLPAETQKALAHYLKEARPSWETDLHSTYLFLSGHESGTMSRQGAWKMVGKYARAANITKKISPHRLRHAFAMHKLAAGVDVQEVQALLGHASPDTTKTVYRIST